ncbi:hypothetical protein CWI42_100050 [Ordospora colligata]|uniref:Uncharacterized protein n=1 Tax=Ordospora colligata OC4 TaxID=1354746 RepID=A0A0B2UD70_9MICR|nr:uncharacterized protein M896_100050 [Ordospora colligata OC4]KHN69021.1 hypothetical protein M896_100050 [Ordospora colligata OC4]TBU14302.1 hypothetical protein CWI40_100060 [Ordospora colligata]TBU14367.1 hypothetical protein CWI41_100060 [Ordospora colligata]TBU17983.1 hypothetical protein CWI42_100050 [Ordospora colligata]
MVFEIYANNSFVGGIFRARIMLKRCFKKDEVADVFVTARIVGVIIINGKEIKVLEAVPVQLQIEQCGASYACVIPKDSVPSMKLKSFEVEYRIVVEMYFRGVKETDAQVFEVYAAGFEPLKPMENVVICKEMIRVGSGEETAFEEIIRSLRRMLGGSMNGIEETVNSKARMIENLGGFMNDVTHRFRVLCKGDVYLYMSVDDISVENERRKIVIKEGDVEIARVEYGKYLIEEDRMVVRYERTVKFTEVFIVTVECINGEIYNEEEILVDAFESERCVFKEIFVLFDRRGCFTVEYGAICVKFAYRVVLDGKRYTLPLLKISSGSVIMME